MGDRSAPSPSKVATQLNTHLSDSQTKASQGDMLPRLQLCAALEFPCRTELSRAGPQGMEGQADSTAVGGGTSCVLEMGKSGHLSKTIQFNP